MDDFRFFLSILRKILQQAAHTRSATMFAASSVSLASTSGRLPIGSSTLPLCSTRPPGSTRYRKAPRMVAARAVEDVPPPPPAPGPSSDQPGLQGQRDISWRELKERYLRPRYLPATFVIGSLTLGLRCSAENFVLADDPVSYIGCAVVTGLLCTAIAWVLFDFTDNPPPGGNFSSPR